MNDQTQLIPSEEIPTRIAGTDLTAAQLPMHSAFGTAKPSPIIVGRPATTDRPPLPETYSHNYLSGYWHAVDIIAALPDGLAVIAHKIHRRPFDELADWYRALADVHAHYTATAR